MKLSYAAIFEKFSTLLAYDINSSCCATSNIKIKQHIYIETLK